MHESGSRALIIRPQQPDWYQRLRLRIRRWSTAGGRVPPWADLLCLMPDLVHLTVCVVRDPRVAKADRALLATVLVYVCAPIDLIPEGLVGVPGLLDDLALLAAAYHAVLTRVPLALLQGYWAGPAPLLDVVSRVMRDADTWLGRRRWRWLQRMAGADQVPAGTRI